MAEDSCQRAPAGVVVPVMNAIVPLLPLILCCGFACVQGSLAGESATVDSSAFQEAAPPPPGPRTVLKELPPPPELPDLDPALTLAKKVLETAPMFQESMVGIDGDPPAPVLAWRLVMESPHADAVFQHVLRSSTLPGRLYALCGLYYTDPPLFQQVVASYRDLQDAVTVQSGCVIYDIEAGRLVDCRLPTAVRLDSRQQTTKEWWTLHPELDRIHTDILGGGYSSEFRDHGGW